MPPPQRSRWRPALPSASTLPRRPFPGCRSISASARAQTRPGIAADTGRDKSFSEPPLRVRGGWGHRRSCLVCFSSAFRVPACPWFGDAAFLSRDCGASLVTPPSQPRPPAQKPRPTCPWSQQHAPGSGGEISGICSRQYTPLAQAPGV